MVQATCRREEGRESSRAWRRGTGPGFCLSSRDTCIWDRPNSAAISHWLMVVEPHGEDAPLAHEHLGAAGVFNLTRLSTVDNRHRLRLINRDIGTFSAGTFADNRPANSGIPPASGSPTSPRRRRGSVGDGASTGPRMSPLILRTRGSRFHRSHATAARHCHTCRHIRESPITTRPDCRDRSRRRALAAWSRR